MKDGDAQVQASCRKKKVVWCGPEVFTNVDRCRERQDARKNIEPGETVVQGFRQPDFMLYQVDGNSGDADRIRS